MYSMLRMYYEEIVSMHVSKYQETAMSNIVLEIENWILAKSLTLTLLHDLRSRETAEFAESIAAVDNRVVGRDLGVAENKVAVCKGKDMYFDLNRSVN